MWNEVRSGGGTLWLILEYIAYVKIQIIHRIKKSASDSIQQQFEWEDSNENRPEKAWAGDGQRGRGWRKQQPPRGPRRSWCPRGRAAPAAPLPVIKYIYNSNNSKWFRGAKN